MLIVPVNSRRLKQLNVILELKRSGKRLRKAVFLIKSMKDIFEMPFLIEITKLESY